MIISQLILLDAQESNTRFFMLVRIFICFTISPDMSPQDTTNLSEIVEMGPLPSFVDEDKETRYAFYILTNQGLRFECSSISQGQVNYAFKFFFFC